MTQAILLRSVNLPANELASLKPTSVIDIASRLAQLYTFFATNHIFLVKIRNCLEISPLYQWRLNVYTIKILLFNSG